MSPEHFLNRELSWLEFNQRVLDEAADPSVPPLDRLKFLAITASNLDEFFMVRVGGLQMLADENRARDGDVAAGPPRGVDPAGMTPEDQLAAIAERCERFVADQYALLGELEDLLAGRGFRRLAADDLNARQAAALEHVFRDALDGVLTPVSVTGPDDFPLVETGAVCVLVRLAPAPPADDGDGGGDGDGGMTAAAAGGSSRGRRTRWPAAGRGSR